MRILKVECFCWICHIFQTVDARGVFCPVPELPTTTVLHLFGQLTNYPILALVLVHYSSKSGVSEDLDNKWFFPAIVGPPNNNPFWSFSYRLVCSQSLAGVNIFKTLLFTLWAQLWASWRGSDRFGDCGCFIADPVSTVWSFQYFWVLETG